MALPVPSSSPSEKEGHQARAAQASVIWQSCDIATLLTAFQFAPLLLLIVWFLIEPRPFGVAISSSDPSSVRRATYSSSSSTSSFFVAEERPLSLDVRRRQVPTARTNFFHEVNSTLTLSEQALTEHFIEYIKKYYPNENVSNMTDNSTTAPIAPADNKSITNTAHLDSRSALHSFTWKDDRLLTSMARAWIRDSVTRSQHWSHLVNPRRYGGNAELWGEPVADSVTPWPNEHNSAFISGGVSAENPPWCHDGHPRTLGTDLTAGELRRHQPDARKLIQQLTDDDTNMSSSPGCYHRLRSISLYMRDGDLLSAGRHRSAVAYEKSPVTATPNSNELDSEDSDFRRCLDACDTVNKAYATQYVPLLADEQQRSELRGRANQLPLYRLETQDDYIGTGTNSRWCLAAHYSKIPSGLDHDHRRCTLIDGESARLSWAGAAGENNDTNSAEHLTNELLPILPMNTSNRLAVPLAVWPAVVEAAAEAHHHQQKIFAPGLAAQSKGEAPSTFKPQSLHANYPLWQLPPASSAPSSKDKPLQEPVLVCVLAGTQFLQTRITFLVGSALYDLPSHLFLDDLGADRNAAARLVMDEMIRQRNNGGVERKSSATSRHAAAAPMTYSFLTGPYPPEWDRGAYKNLKALPVLARAFSTDFSFLRAKKQGVNNFSEDIKASDKDEPFIAQRGSATNLYDPPHRYAYYFFIDDDAYVISHNLRTMLASFYLSRRHTSALFSTGYIVPIFTEATVGTDDGRRSTNSTGSSRENKKSKKPRKVKRLESPHGGGGILMTGSTVSRIGGSIMTVSMCRKYCDKEFLNGDARLGCCCQKLGIPMPANFGFSFRAPYVHLSRTHMAPFPVTFHRVNYPYELHASVSQAASSVVRTMSGLTRDDNMTNSGEMMSVTPVFLGWLPLMARYGIGE